MATENNMDNNVHHKNIEGFKHDLVMRLRLVFGFNRASDKNTNPKIGGREGRAVESQRKTTEQNSKTHKTQGPCPDLTGF